MTQQLGLSERIVHTLQLAEERGYNLTVEQLSQKLLGGSVPPEDLHPFLHEQNGIDSDGVFFATHGHLLSEKCRERQKSNIRLQAFYNQLATDFIKEYRRFCPWVSCVMLSGSMASEGLSEGDDIDFDVVVPDGLKYTSYLLGLLVALKYSLLYGKRFWKRHVMCISVIWEQFQVFPFQRQDEQLAFELLNARVLYGEDFFHYMIGRNPWLSTYVPQLYTKGKLSFPSLYPLRCPTSWLRRAGESFSKRVLHIMLKIGVVTVLQGVDLHSKMVVKHPYELFDVPEGS